MARLILHTLGSLLKQSGLYILKQKPSFGMAVETVLGIENLHPIFNPKRIAVIGASENEDSPGAKILHNLIGVGYKGTVYPVNPFRQTVQGITAYPSITKIPRKVDLAIVATPAHTVPQIIEECGKSGVSGVIIISAGFKEVGAEGAALETKILEYKHKYGMRIIGPSSFGVLRPKINLFATFGDKHPVQGKIAFISQSAALCASAIDWASESQVGFSAVVSTGSMLDVDLGDLIDYFGIDAQTRSIVLYVEFVKDARKFMSAARGFARTKPIVMLKAGRFPESAEVALSHSGSLCGEDSVCDAAFRRVGMVRVDAISDLFSCAEALAMQPNPKGPELTIITNAGGPAILATDNLIARGGCLSKLDKDTIQALRDNLPSYCSLKNPIDVFEEATPNRFKKVLNICLKDPNSSGFLVIYTPQGATDPYALANAVVDASKNTDKPILTTLMGEDDRCRNARRILHKNGVPTFRTPEQAVSTFMYMYSYTQNLQLLYQTPEELSVELEVPTFLRSILKKAFCEDRRFLSLPESMQFLEAYKIPFVKTLVARTPEEALALTKDLEFPIVMKALSPQITHKSEVGGVILNIRHRKQVKAFFAELSERIQRRKPAVEFKGVVLQPMVQKKGYELFIGSKKEPPFGAVILFGMGGTATELHKDVSTGFPPLNQVLAKRLMEKTTVYQYANSVGLPLNDKLLEKILVKFSQLVIDFPEIKEIDINPLIVNQNSAVAVDSRIVIDQDAMMRAVDSREHLVIAPYPKKYTCKWKLKNEVEVIIRPIKPEDEILFNDLFKSLSAETMRFRFFEIIKSMSHQLLTRYCNLDYDREIALVAELNEDERKIVGAARLIIEPSGTRGEFAVLVSDSWQGQGLGSKLLDSILIIAKDMGAKTVHSDVIASNYKMIRLAEKKGFRTQRLDGDTTKILIDFD